MSEALYSLTDKVKSLLNYIEAAENPEELAESLADTKELLDMSIDDKFEGMMTIRQNKLARVDALKAEAKRLTELAKTEEKQVEKIEKYAEFEMQKLGYSHKSKEKMRAVGKFNIGFKKLPPILEIVDASKIPAKYMNIPAPPAPTPDKKELLDLLKLKAETLHGKKWSKEIDGLALEDFGIKMVNSNQKFEIK